MFSDQSGAAALLAMVCVIASSSALYIPDERTLSRSQLFLLYEKVLRLEPRVEDVEDTLSPLDSLLRELTARLDRVQQIATTARDCSGLPPGTTTGIHLLRPVQSTVEAYCDMDTDGGNWTVFQRRDDIKPHQDFYLGWTEYKHGFGNLTGEFWWGLDYLWQLTSVEDKRYELRIDLEAFDGSTAHAVYQDFRISSEEDGYRLRASDYSGDAGDSLQYNVNQQFWTRDRDNDGRFDVSCGEQQQGPWWYGEYCGDSSLNGRYLGRDGYDVTGIWWYSWKKLQSLKKTELKIRPT